jgi:hypothetical protein
VGLQALSLVMGEPAHVTLVNFTPCVDAAVAYADSRVGGAERSAVAVDLLAGLQVRVSCVYAPHTQLPIRTVGARWRWTCSPGCRCE